MEIAKVSKARYKKFVDREFKGFLIDFFGKKKGQACCRAFFAKGKTFNFSAVENGKVVGAVSLHIHEDVARIGAFAVAKDFREKGVGSALLDKCEETAKKNGCIKIWLNTVPSLEAYRFYKKRGYKEEGRLKKHWGGQDIANMSKFFP